MPDGFDPLASGWKRLPARGFPEHVAALHYRGDAGARRFGFLAEPRHANIGGVVHGGMLMTFADDCCGITVWEAVGRAPVTTVQLGTQFISPARPGDFVECAPEILRRTRSVVFIRGTLHIGERTVASVDGVWKILGSG